MTWEEKRQVVVEWLAERDGFVELVAGARALMYESEAEDLLYGLQETWTAE